MSGVYGKRSRQTYAVPAGTERRDHEKADFLATYGRGSTWVHCPMCMCIDDGWMPDGTPRYKGGEIRVEIEGAEMIAACQCEYGEDRNRAAEIPFVREMLKRGATILDPPSAVLWRRGDGNLPPEPVESDPEKFAEYIRRIGQGLAARATGKISEEEFALAKAKLEERLLPPPTPTPTWDEILNGEIRHRYRRRSPINDAFAKVDGAPEPKDGRAAANPDH